MPASLFRYLRVKLKQAGLYPESRLGRFGFYSLAVEILILAVQRLVNAGGLDGWVIFLTILNVVVFSILSFRWIRQVLMWRLRNRLIITYLFIGVIPVGLVATLGLLAAFLFAGQLAIYFATNDLHAQLERLQAANETVAAELADEVKSGAAHPRALVPGAKNASRELLPGNRLQTYFGSTPVSIQAAVQPSNGAPAAANSSPLFQGWIKKSFSTLVVDDNKLYLRAATVVPVNSQLVMAVSSVPVDENLLAQVWKNQAEVVFYTNVPVEIISSKATQEETKQIQAEDKDRTRKLHNWPVVSGGSLPQQMNKADISLSFFSPMPVLDWKDGQSYDTGLQVQTRPSVLYGRLFSISATLATAILTLMVGIAILFGAIVLVAVMIGLGLTRTVTRSVAALYRGTERVNRGDFSHRIRIKSRDQLAALETSFNSMTESLEKLIAEQKEKQRLESELAIAQEVQSQLFPQQGMHLASLELNGICRPARTVSGDYYDFLPMTGDRLALAVGDISGKGISAALLMATIHSAVRVYEFGGMPQSEVLAAAGAVATAAARSTSGLAGVNLAVAGNAQHSPSEIMWLLNRHLFHSTPAEKYATLFLGVYDGARRELTYSNAGHLPPLLLSPDGALRKLDTGGTVIGLFEEAEYEQKCVELAPGDLFVAYSDGITEPENEFGEFGESRLVALLRENLGLPLPQLSETVIGAVKDWMGEGEQPDDITLVLARVR